MVASAGIAAGAASAAPARAARSLPSEIGAALQDPALAGASVSLLAVDTRTRDTLVSLDPDRLLTPASVLKLFVTAAALERLGPDPVRVTRLLGRGALRRGVLHGDLVLFGGGDPNLSGRFADSASAVLDGLIDSLRARGVRRVTGNVVGIDVEFARDERVSPHWEVGDLGEWFAAEVSALALNDDCVDLTFTPGASAGAPTAVTLSPATDYVRVENHVTTGAPGSTWRIDLFRDPGSHVIRAEGSMPAGGAAVTRSGTVPDPPLYAATVLEEHLAARGIRVDGTATSRDTARGGRPSAFPEIVLRSRPLRDLVRVVNGRSQNLHAEMLLRSLSPDRPATVADGIAIERAALAPYGVDTSAVRPVDGSGLARENLVTARAVVALLVGVQTRAPWREHYWTSLPLAGRDGSFRRFAGTAADRRVRVKPGGLTGVTSFAGLAETPRARLIAFAGIVNGPPGSEPAAQRLLDTLAVILAGWDAGRASPRSP